jgi:ferredoxin
MPVLVDADLCTGCGLCEETCPTIFKLDEDAGVCAVLIASPEGDDLECAKQAAEECPVEAIAITAG